MYSTCSNRTTKGKLAIRYEDEFAGLGYWQLKEIADFAFAEMNSSDTFDEVRTMAMETYLCAIQVLNATKPAASLKKKKKRKSNSDSDTLTYWEVKRAPDKDEFFKGMDKEFVELLRTATLTIVPKKEAYEAGAQIVPSTWAFRRKRDQFTGEVKRHKAGLCLEGDLEKSVTETYAPVGTWTTVRMMLTLAARLFQTLLCRQS